MPISASRILPLARRSARPKPACRMVILDGDRRSDGRYLEISASSLEGGATLAVEAALVIMDRFDFDSIMFPVNKVHVRRHLTEPSCG